MLLDVTEQAVAAAEALGFGESVFHAPSLHDDTVGGDQSDTLNCLCFAVPVLPSPAKARASTW